MKPWKFFSRLFGLSPEAWLLSLLRERLREAEDGTYHFTIGRAAVLRLEGQTWVADIHIRRTSEPAKIAVED